MNCTEKRKAGIDVAKKDKQQHADKEQEKVEATAQEATEEQPCTCTEDAQKPEACEADKKQDEAQEAEKKYAELEDKYLRLAAEYTNFQKRTVREKEQIYTDAVVDTVKELLVQAGLEFVAAYDAFTREPPGPKSERVYLVARECQKKNGGFQ